MRIHLAVIYVAAAARAVADLADRTVVVRVEAIVDKAANTGRIADQTVAAVAILIDGGRLAEVRDRVANPLIAGIV
jgi:hypothetical protein